MNITSNTVVTLRYSVADEENKMIDAGEQPLHYLHGGYDGIFPRIEEYLEGKTLGDHFEIVLAPEDAFGLYRVDLMKIEPRHLFPDDIEVGTLFEGNSPDQEDQTTIIYAITDIGEETVIVDGNHPLAGVELTFSGEVIAVRPASAEEIAHQHVHH
jgi:FKBP-type peptidyl-prolyl cis-trans isomerase SlyD